jgi:hypothetical protein
MLKSLLQVSSDRAISSQQYECSKAINFNILLNIICAPDANRERRQKFGKMLKIFLATAVVLHAC